MHTGVWGFYQLARTAPFIIVVFIAHPSDSTGARHTLGLHEHGHEAIDLGSITAGGKLGGGHAVRVQGQCRVKRVVIVEEGRRRPDKRRGRASGGREGERDVAGQEAAVPCGLKRPSLAMTPDVAATSYDLVYEDGDSRAGTGAPHSTARDGAPRDLMPTPLTTRSSRPVTSTRAGSSCFVGGDTQSQEADIRPRRAAAPWSYIARSKASQSSGARIRGKKCGRQHLPDDRRVQIAALPQSGDAGRGPIAGHGREEPARGLRII